MAKKEKSLPKPIPAEIARCAYLIYETRGRQPGRNVEDWLEAEAQLIADRKQEAATYKPKNQQ
jgi:Protein of unknown function (DUF2934)